MMKDAFQLNFSTGAISATQGRVTKYLADTHTQIYETVKASELIMADETSHQRNNDKRWMWPDWVMTLPFSKLTAAKTNMRINDYLVRRFHIFL